MGYYFFSSTDCLSHSSPFFFSNGGAGRRARDSFFPFPCCCDLNCCIGHSEEFDPAYWISCAERLSYHLEANVQKYAILLTLCGTKTFAIFLFSYNTCSPNTDNYAELVAEVHFCPRQRFAHYRGFNFFIMIIKPGKKIFGRAPSHY